MVIINRIFNITGKACSKSSLFSLNKFLNKTVPAGKSSFSTNQSIKLQQKFQQRFDPKRFQPRTTDTNTQNLIWYTMGGLVIMGGMSYAAVPLFKIFCESQGNSEPIKSSFCLTQTVQLNLLFNLNQEWMLTQTSETWTCKY